MVDFTGGSVAGVEDCAGEACDEQQSELLQVGLLQTGVQQATEGGVFERSVSLVSP